MIIGLHGHRHSGRHIVATHLVEEHGFVRLSFADPLYRLALTADPHIGDQKLSELVDVHGWRGLKQHPEHSVEVTLLLQKLGEQVRETFGPEPILRRMEKTIASLPPGTDVVIPDVRLLNEAWFLYKERAYMVRVVRDSDAKLNDDITEQPLPEQFIHRTFNNIGEQDLRMQIDRMLIHLK